MKKLIFGYGATGKAVEKYFQKNNIDYFVYDDKDLKIKNNLIFNKEKINEIDEVIISPGVKPGHNLLNEINSRDLNVNTDIDLFNNLYKGKIIGVTGTNGKTTFVNLLTDYLNSLNIKSVAVGNVGKSPLEIIDETYEFVVMELSSFQLYYINNLNLYKATILNIYEDHLDWHSDYEEYRNSKLKIKDFVPSENFISGDIYLNDINSNYADKESKKFLFQEAGIIDIVSKLSIHEDTLYSFIKISKELNLNLNSLDKYLLNYKTEEHRFELVDKINDITYINDSKSTNFNSVSMATKKINNGILLLHGLTKNITSKDLNISKKVKTILVPEDMEIDLSDTSANVIKLKTIFEIEEILEEIIKPGDTVLFSCGGASFNDFKNYQERGNYFKTVVSNIKEKNA